MGPRADRRQQLAARSAKPKPVEEAPSVVKNPARGATVSAPAGGQVEVLFDFSNAAPFVAGFHLEVDGLPDPSWAKGVGQAAAVMAAAAGGGTLRLLLAPPADAVPGAHNVTVNILSEGVVIPDGEIPLVLQVDPPLVAVAPPPPPEPVADGAGETAADPVSGDAVATPTTSSRPGKLELVYATPTTADTRQPSRPVETARPPAEDPLPLVDLQEAPDADEEEEEAPITEPSVVDPQEGQSLKVRPGETLLVRFRFTNDTRGTQTYVLDEDRSLDHRWITLVQEQVNLTRGGSGEVSVRLSPPSSAEPGDYPFMVRVGPLGGTLTPRNLVLSVQAIPAVRVQAKQQTVKIGPFGSRADFALTVDSIGNSDTAFRISVKSPQAPAEGTEPAPRCTDDLYETPPWCYLFDKEMESLQSLAPNRPPQPQPIRLQLRRNGPWWFGMRESHTVRVAAVPVTDPANGGKGGNALDLTATRWRLLPIPFLALLPVLLLGMMLLSSGGKDLRVENALPYGTSYYVLQTEGAKEDPAKPAVPMAARLTWRAPFYALLNVRATSNNVSEIHRFTRPGFTDTFPVAEYGVDRDYALNPLIRAGNERITVHFMPVRTRNRLGLSATGGAGPISEPVRGDLNVGGKTIEGGQAEYTLTVPKNRVVRLNLSNRASGLLINVWLVQKPDDIAVVGMKEGDSYQIGPGQVKPVQIRYKGGAQPGEADRELVFLTTDANHQQVRVHLAVVP